MLSPVGGSNHDLANLLECQDDSTTRNPSHCSLRWGRSSSLPTDQGAQTLFRGDGKAGTDSTKGW